MTSSGARRAAQGDSKSLKEPDGMDDAPEERLLPEEAVQRLLALLESGEPQWTKTWKGMSSPVSAATGRPYQGFNFLCLSLWGMAKGYHDARWITRRFARRCGGRIRPGEIGAACLYCAVRPAGLRTGESCAREQAAVVLKTYMVYNMEQTEGVALSERVFPRGEWSPQERAEQILAASGAEIVQGWGTQPAYNVRLDRIELPAREEFESAQDFYAAALHELCHWSGHPQRLGRFPAEGPALDEDRKGARTTDCAREELCAEIASMMLAAELGIAQDMRAHAAYVGSWARMLKGSVREICRAVRQAQTIRDYLLDFVRECWFAADLERGRFARMLPREALRAVRRHASRCARLGPELALRVGGLRARRGEEAEPLLARAQELYLAPPDAACAREARGFVLEKDPGRFIARCRALDEKAGRRAQRLVQKTCGKAALKAQGQ